MPLTPANVWLAIQRASAAAGQAAAGR